MATKKQPFHIIEELERDVAMSQAVRLGNTLYIGAMNSVDANGQVAGPDDFDAQLKAVYAKFREVLAAHGAGFENVLKETIYTRDVEALFMDIAHRLEVYGQLPPPALTVVEVSRMLLPDVLVIIDAVVEIPEDA